MKLTMSRRGAHDLWRDERIVGILDVLFTQQSTFDMNIMMSLRIRM